MYAYELHELTEIIEPMRTVGIAPILAAIPLVHHYLVAAIALALKMKIIVVNSQNEILLSRGYSLSLVGNYLL